MLAVKNYMILTTICPCDNQTGYSRSKSKHLYWIYWKKSWLYRVYVISWRRGKPCHLIHTLLPSYRHDCFSGISRGRGIHSIAYYKSITDYVERTFTKIANLQNIFLIIRSAIIFFYYWYLSSTNLWYDRMHGRSICSVFGLINLHSIGNSRCRN